MLREIHEKNGKLLYRSRLPEPVQFHVRRPGGQWNSTMALDGHLEWEIEKDEQAAFERHHHYQTNRIVRKAVY